MHTRISPESSVLLVRQVNAASQSLCEAKMQPGAHGIWHGSVPLLHENIWQQTGCLFPN